MKIEILYPKLCNIFGDSANYKYLELNLPKTQFIYTDCNSTPLFIKEDIDMVYIGSMSEKSQAYTIKLQNEYKEAITDYIESGKIFLATGNSLEIFGNYIEDESGEKTDCLGIFDIYTKRNLKIHHNSWFLGKYEDIDIIGNRRQFSFSYYGEKTSPFFDVKGGVGFNKDTDKEGIAYKNFYATYILGPLLIMNPYLTKMFLKKLNVYDGLKFEKEAIEAYDKRLKFLQEKKDFTIGFHA